MLPPRCPADNGITKPTSAMAVAAVVRKDDHVLMVHQQNDGAPHPLWGLPGGMVEDGELAGQAASTDVQLFGLIVLSDDAATTAASGSG